MDVVGELWGRAVATQPAPPPWVVGLAFAVAVLLVAPPASWRVTRHVVTIAHEGAHGVAALATGRRLAGIRLHSDTSGVAVSVGRRTGPGMVVTAAAGYVGPALLGLGAALLLGAGYAVGLLWAVVLLLALLLVQIRNWFGLLSVLVTGGLVVAVSWWLPPAVQSGFAYLLAWFLLLAAPRPVVELQRHRWRQRQRGRASGSSDSDADQLARLTGLPGIAWVVLFLAVTLGALVLGAGWLLP
jgi:hypothetical protein